MSYGLIKFIAVRFSKSNKRQGFISFAKAVAFASVMFGTLALLISLSVLSGFEKVLKDNAVKFTSHITVVSFNRQPLRNYKASIEKLRNDIPEIKSLAPVIQRESMIRSSSLLEGIVLKGIQNDYEVTDIKTNIVEGRFLNDKDGEKQIIISKRLSGKLSVKIGDTVVVYAMRESPGSQITYPDIDRFRISGIYETGMAKYDDVVAFIQFETALNSFKMNNNTTSQIEVVLHDINKVDAVAEKIEDLLGYPHFCYTVFELHSSIFSWIELQKQPIPLVLGLITIVAVFNIFTILLITVIEKTYSIGILSALGMNSKGIMKIFVLKGTTIGVAGTLTGAAIAFVFSLLQQNFHLIRLKGEIYFLDSLPIEINYIHYLVIISITIAMSFVATLIPSYFASKANPIRAIHFK